MPIVDWALNSHLKIAHDGDAAGTALSIGPIGACVRLIGGRDTALPETTSPIGVVSNIVDAWVGSPMLESDVGLKSRDSIGKTATRPMGRGFANEEGQIGPGT